jgi:peptidoglycan/LPS O-acetylase OafA/YrhL
MKYMHQLDSLRAIAVIAVLAWHFNLFTHTRAHLNTGEIGVSLFFVLSGFLITQILLKYRQDVANGDDTPGDIFKKFYIRRTLRIFPIYYITIIAICVLNYGNARSNFFWNLAYLANVKVSLDGIWSHSIAHFWSLSVEEQFYLLWPWLIFYTPKKYLVKSIYCTIAIAPLSRLFFAIFIPNNDIVGYASTFCCLDFLGFGGLLALFTFYKVDSHIQKERLVRSGLFIGAPLFMLLLTCKMAFETPSYLTFFSGTAEALFYVWLISRASENMSGFIGSILDFKPLVKLGKISYGMYLFHPFIGRFCTVIFSKLFGIQFDHGFNFFIVSSFATVCFASCSWSILEKPINELKNRFERPKLNPVVEEASFSA